MLSLRCCSRDFSTWLRCVGLSLRRLLLLRSTGCRHVGLSSCSAWAQDCGSKALEHSLGSWGAWAWLLQGMWHLPGSGIEPVSPALAGGFLNWLNLHIPKKLNPVQFLCITWLLDPNRSQFLWKILVLNIKSKAEIVCHRAALECEVGDYRFGLLLVCQLITSCKLVLSNYFL